MTCTKKCPMCRETPEGCEFRLFRNGFFYPVDKYNSKCRECNCKGNAVPVEKPPLPVSEAQPSLFDA